MAGAYHDIGRSVEAPLFKNWKIATFPHSQSPIFQFGDQTDSQALLLTSDQLKWIDLSKRGEEAGNSFNQFDIESSSKSRFKGDARSAAFRYDQRLFFALNTNSLLHLYNTESKTLLNSIQFERELQLVHLLPMKQNPTQLLTCSLSKSLIMNFDVTQCNKPIYTFEFTKTNENIPIKLFPIQFLDSNATFGLCSNDSIEIFDSRNCDKSVVKINKSKTCISPFTNAIAVNKTVPTLVAAQSSELRFHDLRYLSRTLHTTSFDSSISTIESIKHETKDNHNESIALGLGSGLIHFMNYESYKVLDVWKTKEGIKSMKFSTNRTYSLILNSSNELFLRAKVIKAHKKHAKQISLNKKIFSDNHQYKRGKIVTRTMDTIIDTEKYLKSDNLLQNSIDFHLRKMNHTLALEEFLLHKINRTILLPDLLEELARRQVLENVIKIFNVKLIPKFLNLLSEFIIKFEYQEISLCTLNLLIKFRFAQIEFFLAELKRISKLLSQRLDYMTEYEDFDIEMNELLISLYCHHSL